MGDERMKEMSPMQLGLLAIGSTLMDRGKNQTTLPGLLQGILNREERQDERAKDEAYRKWQMDRLTKNDASAAQVQQLQMAQMRQGMESDAQYQNMISEKYPQIAGMPKAVQSEVLKSLLVPKKPNTPQDFIKFQLAQQNPAFAKFLMDQKRAGATNVTTNVGGQNLTPGQEAMDKEFGKQLATSSGSSDSEKLIGQLEQVHKSLGSSDSMTGPVVGSIPDAVNKWINPDAINTRDQIEEVVQRNLKEILGSQFTEEEGERLIARAFNPNLEEDVNKQRVGRLIAQMKAASATNRDKEAYFREKGTLRGWTGKTPSFQDFYDALEGESKATPLPANPTADTLTPGTIYDTPKGKLRWNGKMFEDL